jgi:hypothetical protein
VKKYTSGPLNVNEPVVAGWPLRMFPSCHVPPFTKDGSGFDEQLSQGDVGVTAVQAPTKVKLELLSSTVEFVMAL